MHRPRASWSLDCDRGEAPQAAQQRIRAKNCQLSKSVSFALDVELEFCKRLNGLTLCETEIEICQTGRRPISCQSTLAAAAVVLEVRMGQSPRADRHVFLAPPE